MNTKIPPLSCGNVHAQVFATGIEIRSRGSWLDETEARALSDWLTQVVGNADSARYNHLKQLYGFQDEYVDSLISG